MMTSAMVPFLVLACYIGFLVGYWARGADDRKVRGEG